jgi:hypothetical protein
MIFAATRKKIYTYFKFSKINDDAIGHIKKTLGNVIFKRWFNNPKPGATIGASSIKASYVCKCANTKTKK